MVNKILVFAGFLLPLALLGEMCFHLRELNSLVQTAVYDGTRNLVALQNVGGAAANSRKPLFVLHIGPGKTGTTTVQWAASEHVGLLERQNFYYLGHHGSRKDWNLHDLFRTCYDADKKFDCMVKWQEFGRIVENHHEQNHNVLVSEEMITGFRNDEIEQEHLWNYLLPLLSKWDVRIVFTYRRFNEWIPSKYHQAFQPNGFNVHEAKRVNWPGQNGGKATPTFTSFFDYMLAKESFMFPTAVYQRWKERFPNSTVIYNMHEAGDFIENFYCQNIPEAGLLCKALGSKKKEVDTKEIKNSSTEKPLHFDMLAVRAFQKKWLHEHLTRRQVAQGIQAHAEELGYEKMTDFEVECFTRNQTEYLLLQSLAFEKSMVPEFYLKHKKELKQQFKEDVEEGKLCSVDVDKSLKNASWRKFLQNLNPDNIPALTSRRKKEETMIEEKHEEEESSEEDHKVVFKDYKTAVFEEQLRRQGVDPTEYKKKLEEQQRQEELEAEELAEKMAKQPYKVPADFFDNY